MDILQNPHVLIVDDDDSICELLEQYLTENGYEVKTMPNGKLLLRELEQFKPNVLILDWMLPGEDGIALCTKVRTVSTVPILMLTARGGTTDRIVGLEVGADDYLAKPFEPRELLARLKSLIRRSQMSHHDSEKTELQKVRFAEWVLDLSSHILYNPAGEQVTLSSHEYKLLKLFIDSPMRVLSRDYLMQEILGREQSPFDRAIDMQVSRLRQRFKYPGTKPTQLLQTIRQEGYRLSVPVYRVS